MGSIYKLSDGELNYYGSTINLTKRFTFHKSKANKCTSNQLNKDALYIEVVEVVEDAKQLLIRERWFIENNECVNRIIPYLTIEEAELYQRNYQSKYQKTRAIKNKIKLNTFYTCECGSTIKYCSKWKHVVSAKHKRFIRDLNTLPQD